MGLRDQSLEVRCIIKGQEVVDIIIRGTEIKFIADTYKESF